MAQPENATPTKCQTLCPVDTHSSLAKRVNLDPDMPVPQPMLPQQLLPKHDAAPSGYEALSECQVALPSPQPAFHTGVPESGHENLDLPPPSPLLLPQISESLAPHAHDVLSIETGPLLKKSRHMQQKPGQLIEACEIEVNTDPLASGTTETDTRGEEQMEAQQMDLCCSEDDVCDSPSTEVVPHARQREMVPPQDTSSGGSNLIQVFSFTSLFARKRLSLCLFA